jgi:very-short-patch-repair endonuclease
VQEEWLRYLIDRWQPWAEEHRRWKAVHDLYGKLFAMYQQLGKLGESYELVLGLGLLTWVSPTGHQVRRHILAGQATLSFDENRGTLAVRGGADGVKLCLEEDMLEPAERPVLGAEAALEDRIRAVSETPWDKSQIEPILRAWIHCLDAEAHYDDGLEPPPVGRPIPQLTYAPALVLRKRTARSLVRSLASVERQIREGGEIPFGIRRLCEILADAPGPAGTGHGPSPPDSEILFPLAFNEDQYSIACRLEHSRGILVQGPPGTGKSHTIANLICHLLATGERVLVTSQTPRALKVLQEKLPAEMVALCVSVLGNDAASLEHLQKSVQGITNKEYGWKQAHNDQEILKLEAKLFQAKKRIAEIDLALRELRERETYEHDVAGGAYRGTAARIAEAVENGRSMHGWFPDCISDSTEAPFPGSRFADLLNLYRRIAAERARELSLLVLPLSGLPDVQTFRSATERERDARERCDKHGGRLGSPSVAAIRRAPKDVRNRARKALLELQDAITKANRLQAWAPRAIEEIFAGQTAPWQQLHDSTSRESQGLRARAERVGAYVVHVPSGRDRATVRADAMDLADHLSRGGRLGWGPFRSALVKRCLYLTHEVKVNGRVCNNLSALLKLIEYLDVAAAIDRLWELWRGIADRAKGTLLQQVAVLEEPHRVLATVLEVARLLGAADQALAAIPGLGQPDWRKSDTISALLLDLQAAEDLDILQAVEEKINAWISQVVVFVDSNPGCHAMNSRLLQALRQRDSRAWGLALHEMEELERDRGLLSERESLTELLRAVAANLARALRRDFGDPGWDERLKRIETTWAWARADAWLRAFLDTHDESALENERQRLETQLRDTTAAVAAAKAWGYCFKRMSAVERQNLMAWSQAIRQIGKGTGRRAEHLRRAAQKYMDQCRGAIPAWIMPFYRVSETIDPVPEMFDVVIVDEASQSGPEALLLFYLAKKVVVVGDDQQISPDAVGIDLDAVSALTQRHIQDLPQHELLDPQTSLFTQAVIRFGGRIVLREHFRCMPEIIRFSNDLCYSGSPLLPLRQYPPQRLEPVVVTHVRNGFREGGPNAARNRPEAEALVEAICACCDNPVYDGKTMGVISLQGEYQADIIQRMLQEHLDPEEIHERRIVCGDAYAFQGDERDVMFLSLVAAPNERIGALTKEADKRRFNVGASRARDQMWLFHTATVNDLNPDDMRCKLLAYCQNPAKSILGEPQWERCESDFERAVGRRIHARGYRLWIQFEPFGPGGKRIDFVVDGARSRLAVECDGDYWHGPDEYEADSLRQRQLERCGWVFWRLGESAFHANPDRALESLWEKLTEMEIHPAGHEPRNDVPPPPHQEELANGHVSAVATQAELFGSGNRQIDDIQQDEIRAALNACLAPAGKVQREMLLRSVARKLGFSRLGPNIRKRLNRAIGAEIRAGRLQSQDDCVSRTPGLFDAAAQS